MKARKGFTLIELLVVIAIIGILSAVVLASLNTARTKGSDAGVKANLDTVATQAALFLTNNNNSYGVFNDGSGAPTTCPAPNAAGAAVFHDTTIENAIAAAALDAAATISTYCVSTATAYAAATKRPVPASGAPTTSTFWCVDSTGVKCGNDGSGGDNATPIVSNACVACTTTN
ncbi:type II secretion system protein [Candidatus Kaiserbacteria bacterium]|nr:type II secretion system protein [Candidatus Kaiserbacteria bacterium]